jgi:hypothetical protein
MYVVREIFHLKFGHFREAKALFQEAIDKGMMPKANSSRVLSDFTGHSYRLIMESTFDSLGEFEKALQADMNQAQWQEWYTRFKEQVVSSRREILKVIVEKM